MEELGIPLMQVISYNGGVRSLCFEALQSYRNGDREAGRKQHKDAEENLYTTEWTRSRILKQSANGGFGQISLLMAHAEDQIMANEIAYQVTRELFHYMSETKG